MNEKLDKLIGVGYVILYFLIMLFFWELLLAAKEKDIQKNYPKNCTSPEDIVIPVVTWWVR